MARTAGADAPLACIEACREFNRRTFARPKTAQQSKWPRASRPSVSARVAVRPSEIAALSRRRKLAQRRSPL